MRTAIILSPHFPPSSLAGVHRARHLAKHLPAHGWHPIILRAHERHYTEPLDHALAALLPPDIEQVRTEAFAAPFCRKLGVGDIGIRAYVQLEKALRRLIGSRSPDVVMITGSPFYPMLLARRVERLGIPVVLDFQDPWVSAWGASQRRLSKPGAVHAIACTLEPKAVKAASFVTSVSERQNEEMASRYAWFDSSRMAAIPIGGDPEDFAAMRGGPVSSSEVTMEPGLIHLSYVGTFLPRAGALVRTLFKSMKLLAEAEPGLAEQLRFNFVGTSNQRGGAPEKRVTPIAEQEGVGRLVRETPQRVGFVEALRIISNSHGLLLIGSDEPHYTASKIYPALMSGRPYVSLFHNASSAHAILSAAGGGAALAFREPAEIEGLTLRLSEAIRRLVMHPDSLGSPDPASYRSYTASSIAGRFAEVFERVASDRPPNSTRISTSSFAQGEPRARIRC